MSIIVITLLCSCGSSSSTEDNSSAKESSSKAASDSSEKQTEISDSSLTSDTSTSEASSVPDSNKNKTLVVYFSHTGNTRPVAKYIHDKVGGDLVELEPVEAYPEGYSDALDPAKKEQRENARPAIKNKIENFDSYDVIYLGYPIWWGTTPMLINTFLESYDFSGKTVVPFATSGGTGIEKSIEDIRSEVPKADVKDGLLVKDNDDIDPWLEKLGLS